MITLSVFINCYIIIYSDILLVIALKWIHFLLKTCKNRQKKSYNNNNNSTALILTMLRYPFISFDLPYTLVVKKGKLLSLFTEKTRTHEV